MKNFQCKRFRVRLGSLSVHGLSLGFSTCSTAIQGYCRSKRLGKVQRPDLTSTQTLGGFFSGKGGGEEGMLAVHQPSTLNLADGFTSRDSFRGFEWTSRDSVAVSCPWVLEIIGRRSTPEHF